MYHFKKVTSYSHSLFITLFLSLGKVGQMLFVSSFVFHQHNRYKGTDLIFFFLPNMLQIVGGHFCIGLGDAEYGQVGTLLLGMSNLFTGD